MSALGPRVVRPDLIESIEQYVDRELRDAASYENRELFDESGVFALHRLAAEIYAAGWQDGEAAQATRDRYQRRRGES